MSRDTEDNGYLILGITWFLCSISGVFLGLRLYAKISRVQRLWWDDYIVTLSWLFLLAETCITQASRRLGLGKHVWVIGLDNAFALTRLTYIGATISCFASTFSKIAFGVTLLRLTKGKLRIFVWCSIISLFIVMLPSAFISWIQCRPVEKLWNPYVQGECWSGTVVQYYGIFNAAFCAIVDFALALIPWKVLWGLKLQTKEKIGVGIAMSMGLLAGMCAIIKGIYLKQVTDIDFFYNGKDVTIWTAVETATAIIGACIPVLRVFFKNTVHSLHDRYHRSDLESKPNKSSSLKGSSFRLSSLKSPKGTHTSVRSVPGIGDLGTVISNEHSGILQTNTVTVEYTDYEKILKRQET